MRSRARFVVLTLLAALATGASAGSTPTVGVIYPEGDAEAADALAGVVDGLRRGRSPAPEILERAISPGETAAGAALAELRNARVDLIIAVTDAATTRVRDSLRDLPVVFAAADAATAAELRTGGNACVTSGVPAEMLVADLRRAVPNLRRVGVYVPPGDEAARTSARELAGETDAVAIEVEGATPALRAAAAVARLLPDSNAMWLPPSVSAAEAAALAEAMARSRVPLIGSRQPHLAAGCAVVIRSSPRDLGALAAVMANEILAGADPGKIPIRRTRRRLVEVNLSAASKLGYRVPVTLLAWADSVLRPWAVKR